MAMCLSLSGTVILSCLFLPKLRVVLLKPDKNVRGKGKITMRPSTATASNPQSASQGNIKKIGAPPLSTDRLLNTPVISACSSEIKNESSTNSSSVKKGKKKQNRSMHQFF